MSKYRKIFHHVSSKDVRKKHQDNIAQLRIKEEKEIKILDHTSSAMKVVKYDWRSDKDLGAELREGMTTANVYQKLGDTSEDGELETQVIDTSLEASFEDSPVNGLQNMMFKGVAIKDGGTGSGDNGGFDIGKHLAFSHNANSDGSSYNAAGSRHALLSPIDARNIDTITITAIRGNDQNGGELPDATDEDLRLMWFNPDPNGTNGVGDWMNIDFESANPITRHNDVSPIIIPRISGGEGSSEASEFPALRDWTITIPDYCKNENQRFALYQQTHSGRQYDHYGITQIKYRARTPTNAFVALDKPEASSFVRFGTNEGDPKKRKKKLEDQLKASKEYTDTVLGTDFPGGSATLSEPESSPIGYDQLSKTHIQAGTLSQQLKKALGKETSTEKTASTTLDKIKQLTKDPIDPKLIVPDKPVSTPSELGIDEGTPVAEVIKKISNKPGAEKVPELQTIEKYFPDYKPNKDAPPGWKLGSVDGIEPWPEDPRLEGTEWDPKSSNYKTLERRTLEKKVPSLDKVEEYFPEYKNDDAPPGWKLEKNGNLEPWLEDQRLVGTEWDPRAYLNSELVSQSLPDNAVKELDKIDQGEGWGKKILDMTEKVIKSTLEKQLETNEWEEKFTRKVTTAGEIYLRYLSNTLPEKITNETLGQKYIEDSFKKAHFNNRGTVTLGEYVIGSGQVPTYNPKTGLVSLKFNYDFDTNTQAIMKEPDKYDPTKLWNAVGMTGAWIVGGKYGIDSVPVPLAGYATWLAKLMGSAQHTPGEITIPLEWLEKNNNAFYLELYNRGILDDTPVDDDPEKEPIDDDPEKEPIDEPSDPIPLPPKFPPGWSDDVHTQILSHGWDVGANFKSFGDLSMSSYSVGFDANMHGGRGPRLSTIGNYKSSQDIIGQAPIEGKVDYKGDVTRYWPMESLMNQWQESSHAWSRPWIDNAGKGERPEDKVISMQDRHAIIGSLPNPTSLRGAATSYSFKEYENSSMDRTLKRTNDKIESQFKYIDKRGTRGDYTWDRNTRKGTYTPWSEQKIAEEKYRYISSAYVDQAVRINQNKYWMDDLSSVYPANNPLSTLGNFIRSVNVGGKDQDMRYKLQFDPAFHRPMDSYNVHEKAYGSKYYSSDGEQKLTEYGEYHEKALANAYRDSGLSEGKWTGKVMKWDNEIAKDHYKLIKKSDPKYRGRDQNGKSIRGYNWELDPEYQYHYDIKRVTDQVHSTILKQRAMLDLLSTQMNALVGPMGYDPNNYQTDQRAVERVKQNDAKSNQSILPGWLKNMLTPGVANVKSSPSVEKKDVRKIEPKTDIKKDFNLKSVYTRRRTLDDPESSSFVRFGKTPKSKKKRKKSNYIKSKVSESRKENSFDKIRRVSRDYDYDKIKIVEEPIVSKPKVKVVQEIKKRSDWRTELKESDWTPVSSGRPTMSTSQTFQHASGATATFNALSGPDAHPNTVNITAYGDTWPVDAPTINEIPLQGHASPIDGWKMARKNNVKKASQINAQLDASEKATKMASGASEIMKARVRKDDEPFNLHITPQVHKQRLEEVKVWKEKVVEERQKWEDEKQQKFATRNNKVSAIAKKYGLDLDGSVWGGRDAIAITKGGKYLVIASKKGGIYWREHEQVHLQVYEAEKGKLITVEKLKKKIKISSSLAGKYGSGGGGLADRQYKGIGGTVYSNDFDVEIPEFVPPEPPKFMKANMKLGWSPIGEGPYDYDKQFMNAMKGHFAFAIKRFLPGAEFAGTLAIKYAEGDLTPITKSPGRAFDSKVVDLVKRSIQLGNNPIGVIDDVYNQVNPVQAKTDLIARLSLGRFNYKLTSKGIQVIDQFDFTDGNLSLGAAGKLPGHMGQWGGLQKDANMLVQMATRKAAELGYDMKETIRNEQTGKLVPGVIPPPKILSHDEMVTAMIDAEMKGEPWDPRPEDKNTQTRPPDGYAIPINYTIPWSQFKIAKMQIMDLIDKKKPVEKVEKKKEEGRLDAYGGVDKIYDKKKTNK